MEPEEDSLDEIIPGLYLSGFKKAERKYLLLKHHITHILTVCEDIPPLYPDEHIYKVVPIDDDQSVNIRSLFEDNNACEFLRFIEQALSTYGKVLVHCLMGASRSASTVIAYIMWKRHLRLPAALELVLSKHKDTDPNPGFLQQLKDYECLLVSARQFPEHADCVFRCGRCSALVFDWSDVVTHTSENPAHQCSSYFLKNAEWMRAWNDSGAVSCYLCKKDIGRYETEVGMDCACGKRILPAYRIDPLQ